MDSQYLNTDLDLVSALDPQALVEALNVDGVAWCETGAHGKWYAGPINAPGSGESGRLPDQDIRALLDRVDGLASDLAELWSGCESRELNIGWQATAERPEGAFTLEPDVLARMATHRVILSVTIYPSCEDDRGPPPPA